MAGTISLRCDGHKFSGSWKSKFLFCFSFNATSLKKNLLTRHKAHSSAECGRVL